MKLTKNNISINVSGGITEITDLKRDVTWKLDPLTTQRDFVYDIRDDYIEITLPVCDADKVTMPSSFGVDGAEKKQYLLPIMQGMLWNGDGKPFESYRWEAGHHGFAMPMFAVLSDKGGYLYVAETMDNCGWIVGKDDSERTYCYNVQNASAGGMRYDRKSRIYFTDNTITAAAKQYREYVKSKGRFITFREKIEKRPALERLFGALMCYIGYCQDDIDYVENFKRLKEYGFDRALAYPVRFNTYTEDFLMGGQPPINLSDGEIEEIKALGYDVAPWTWINEAIDDGTDVTRAMYRRTRDGNTKLSWQIDDFKYYNVCAAYMEEFYRKQRNGRFSGMTWDHFDVITCATNGECYDKTHPAHEGEVLTKSADREYLRKLLSAAGDAGGAVSSESFNDAYSLEYDLGSVKAWAKYDNFIFKPIPLTMLVYHDSIIHSWWEVHSYNSSYFAADSSPFYQYGGGAYELQATMDALYGCPPDVFPFGAQYCWTGNGKETMLYKFRFDDPETQLGLKLALPVAENHRKIGMIEMTDFTFLSDDCNLQRTTFEDGTRIYANFSLSIKNHAECGAVLPKSWKRIDP